MVTKLTVLDVFSITGRGTVFTTRAMHRSVQTGDTIVRGDKELLVTGIEMTMEYKDPLNPRPTNLGILTRGSSPEDFEQGDEWIVVPMRCEACGK